MGCGQPLPAGTVYPRVEGAAVPAVSAQQRVIPFQPKAQRRQHPLQPVLRQTSLFPQDSTEPAGAAGADLPASAVRPSPRKKTAPGASRTKEEKRSPGPLLAGLDATLPTSTLPSPRVSVQCNAKVADLSLRAQAAIVDLLVVLPGFLLFFGLLAVLRPWMGPLPWGLWPMLIYGSVYVLLLAWYKIAAAAFGRCTVGLRRMGLEVVRFTGRSPGVDRRLLRVFGGFLTCGAGFLWPFIEPERLAIPDLISETFVTSSKTRR